MFSIFPAFAKKACPLFRPSFTKNYSIIPPYWISKKQRPRIEVEPEPPPSFEELKKESVSANEISKEKINIGVEYEIPQMSRLQRIKLSKTSRANTELEKAARLQELKVPLEGVHESWKETHRPVHVKDAAEHYGIFEDLFFGASFYPVSDLQVEYEYDSTHVIPVCRGNIITPTQAFVEPSVDFDCEPDTLWTLLCVNPDGHLTQDDHEYLHLAIGNIPENRVSEGHVLCPYMPPFPVRGTGFHRFVFLLFKQEKMLDYEVISQSGGNCSYNLEERTFQTLEFFRDRQADLTPMGLAFFQSEWDDSVTDFFHKNLDMKEPSYEFIFPPVYHPPQVKYPRRQPFNRYFERYMDRKVLSEEVLRMKLKTVSPFKPEEPRSHYPAAHRTSRFVYKPTWLREREQLIERRREQFKHWT